MKDKQPRLFEAVTGGDGRERFRAPFRRGHDTQEAGARAAAPVVYSQCRQILSALAFAAAGDMTQREIEAATNLPINIVSARVNAMEGAEPGRPFLLAESPWVRCSCRRGHRFSRVRVKAYTITEAGQKELLG